MSRVNSLSHPSFELEWKGADKLADLPLGVVSFDANHFARSVLAYDSHGWSPKDLHGPSDALDSHRSSCPSSRTVVVVTSALLPVDVTCRGCRGVLSLGWALLPLLLLFDNANLTMLATVFFFLIPRRRMIAIILLFSRAHGRCRSIVGPLDILVRRQRWARALLLLLVVMMRQQLGMRDYSWSVVGPR